MLGRYRPVRIHVDLSVQAVSVIPACHIGPTEVGVQQPALFEFVFIAERKAEHHAVAFAIAVFEPQFATPEFGFRHIERHHADVPGQIPTVVMLSEIAAVFVHKNPEQHVFAIASDLFPR